MVITFQAIVLAATTGFANKSSALVFTKVGYEGAVDIDEICTTGSTAGVVVFMNIVNEVPGLSIRILHSIKWGSTLNVKILSGYIPCTYDGVLVTAPDDREDEVLLTWQEDILFRCPRLMDGSHDSLNGVCLNFHID